MGLSGRFTHGLLYWIVGTGYYRLYTGYVLRVELPVQRRLCPIFVRDIESSGIHECFRGLMGSQRTPRFWCVTVNCFRIALYVISVNCLMMIYFRLVIIIPNALIK